jgi:hypothetical protein
MKLNPNGHSKHYSRVVSDGSSQTIGYVVELMIQHVLPAGVKCRPPASAHNLDSVSIELDLLCCVAGYVVLHSLTSFLVRSDAFWRNIIDRRILCVTV